jgi:uncharacterized phage protein (predicted DNA packaging)
LIIKSSGGSGLPFFCAVNLKRLFVGLSKDKTEIDMKWLTLDWIKKHSRIDFDCEDELLTLYGESAEDTVLNVIARSYTEVIEHYGEVPKPLHVAALMLVEVSYTQRAPMTQTNLYTVPYAFDLMVKPYMKLASDNEQTNTQGYGKCKNL